MEERKDYYKILGIDKNADENTIKKHTVNWQRNIIRIPMPEMHRQPRVQTDHRSLLGAQ